MRRKNNKLTLFGLRGDLLRVGSTGSHVVRQPQELPLAELLNVGVSHAGAHPSAGACHGRPISRRGGDDVEDDENAREDRRALKNTKNSE